MVKERAPRRSGAEARALRRAPTRLGGPAVGAAMSSLLVAAQACAPAPRSRADVGDVSPRSGRDDADPHGGAPPPETREPIADDPRPGSRRRAGGALAAAPSDAAEATTPAAARASCATPATTRSSTRWRAASRSAPTR
ncbi:MAG: hypothetical protein H6713_30530 [Myxococcales bacterium]|nr:hypothetical protein [Myxococcales bacterium]